MSTSMPDAGLFAKLFDDAAVFPPRSASLNDALRLRTARTGHLAADLVGPLLLPPPLVAAALTLPEPQILTVVGRPGMTFADVLAAATAVAEHGWHALASIQTTFNNRWQDTLSFGVPVAIEVQPGDGVTLDELVAAGATDQVRAKLRLGVTPLTSAPSPAQIASFLHDCVHRGLSFKLTGGTPHAITFEDETGVHAGFLNLLAATAALQDGDTEGGAALLLDERRADEVAARLGEVDTSQADVIRNAFQASGSVDPDESIADLRSLGLIAGA